MSNGINRILQLTDRLNGGFFYGCNMDNVTIKGRKGGGGGGHTPVESPDSIQSIARAKMLFALGEGEFAGGLDGTNIFADGTPALNADGSENFPGFRWEFRRGTQAQDYIPRIQIISATLGHVDGRTVSR